MISLDDYAYDFPKNLIAHEPCEPRDQARLFVYDTLTNTVTLDHFYNVAKYVAPALLVLNETKVVPARLNATNDKGESIEVFILFDQGVIDGQYVHALVNRFVPNGTVLTVAPDCVFVVVDNSAKHMVLAPQFDPTLLVQLLDRYGTTPVPPYIHAEQPEATLRERYQTVFAATPGSVAAPTASLHFTDDTFASLTAAGASLAKLSLRVGLGTFAPVLPEHITDKRLHGEYFTVRTETAVTIARAKQERRPVCAVGTTVVRTLESAARDVLSGQTTSGVTELFIMPPHTFMVPDMLLTNFHVPRSSLLMLVDAFLKHKRASRDVLSLYEEAIQEQFRLFSFGDAMLIM